MNRSTQLTLLAATLASAFALAACDRNDTRTAGERVDGAVAGAKSAGGEIKQESKEAMGTVAGAATDATITTKINAALAADDQLKATKIDVDTRNGHVVLTGAAPDATSRDRATTLAKAVDGVVQVDNRLTVKGG